MEPMPVNAPDNGEEQDRNSLDAIPNGTLFSYNLDEGKTPGGLKVRWKVRVAAGPEASRLDARQAEAIRELLEWAKRHQAQARGHGQ